MKLYEYAVIYNPLPTKDQKERGETPKSELIVDVTRVLSNNEKEASMMGCKSDSGDLHGQARPRGDRSPPFLAPPAKQAEKGRQDIEAVQKAFAQANKPDQWAGVAAGLGAAPSGIISTVSNITPATYFTASAVT